MLRKRKKGQKLSRSSDERRSNLSKSPPPSHHQIHQIGLANKDKSLAAHQAI